MNKAERQRIKIVKYKRRLRDYQILDDSKGNFYALRSHGKPCSCNLCSDLKFSRKEKHRISLMDA